MSNASHTLVRPNLRLRMACNLTEVRPVAAAVRAFLANQGCGEKDITDCELALVEACNNAIQHAPGGSDETVEIEALNGPGSIELRVTDHTPGFDWPVDLRLPSPESETGRGLFLIRALMDDVHYAQGPGGNTLALLKKKLSFGSPR
jgi:serine/threonine-protein kinase RsbW